MATLTPLSSSTAIPSTFSPKRHFSLSKSTISLNTNTPFLLSFPLSLSTSRPTSLPPSTNRANTFSVRCQNEETVKETEESFLLRSIKEKKPIIAPPHLKSKIKAKVRALKRKIKEKKDEPYVPDDERWLFEEHELDGPDIWNTTWYPKARDHVNTEKKWYVVDATDKILGRLASTIAIYIRGKNLGTYTPSVDMGAFVIVVNAEKVAVSGKKRTQKLYRRHSGRPGGLKVETFDQLQQRIPERIIEHAVRGMLPKGRLGRAIFNHLKVYKGPDHLHEAQKPIELPIRDKRIQLQR